MRLVLAAIIISMASRAAAVEDMDGSLAKLSKSDQIAVLDAIDRNLANGLNSIVRSVKTVERRRICGLINPTDRSKIHIGFRSFLVDLDSRQIYFEGQGFGSNNETDITALIFSECNNR